MVINHDLPENANWKIICNTTDAGRQFSIFNVVLPIELPKSTYDYDTYNPVVLAPMSKSSTFVLSEYFVEDKIGLRIHDLRLVDNMIVSSINFTMRGHQSQLVRLRDEMIRVCDADRCVGVLFLFRKIYYGGWRTMYADKILKPKQNSTLRKAINIITASMINPESEDKDKA